MRLFLRKIIGNTYKPLIERYYLTKARKVKALGLELLTDPAVFHPSLFYSSKYFGRFIKDLPLQGKTLLDVGCGSGILGLVAAREGAVVTSVDLNPHCIRVTEYNSKINAIPVNVILSDLFNEVDGKFNVVVINPPYYPGDPKDVTAHAWYCGANFDYFNTLFTTLSKVIDPDTRVYMVLSDGCDIHRITSIGLDNGFELNAVREKQFILEKNFIFEISVHG